MQQWYYVDRGHNRQGPVPAEQVAQAYRQGKVTRDSLVWRDGLEKWEPLGEHLAELGLDQPGPPAPPPAEIPAPAAAALAAAPVQAPAAAAGPDEVVDAGFLRRFAAFFLDSLIVSGVFYTLYLVGFVLFALSMAGGGEPDEAMVMAGALAMSLLYVLLSLAYYAGMESSSRQATLGKMALGIKVVDARGQRLGFGHAAGRWLASALSYLTFYIGFAMAGFTARKQGLHDLVANTYVVDQWAYTDQPGRQQRGPSGCLAAAVVGGVLLVLLFVAGILAAIALPAYQDYVERAGRAASAASADLAGPMAQARALATQVDDFRRNTDRCPRDPEELGHPGSAPPDIEAFRLFEDALGRCVVAVDLGDAGTLGEASGGTLHLRLDGQGGWTCEASGIPEALVPADCR
ncbi:RDD family protein [Arenimonas sp.]|uniref:RDD family protein n=1 Tax=Arenimonas sp. TaxID=1872635 RepID=UPI0035B180A3